MNIEVLAAVLFGLAILHTFSVKRFAHWAHRYPEGSVGENVFHLLAEVEVVFGLWAGILLLFFLGVHGNHEMVQFLEGKNPKYGLNFTEPSFVFVIMVMAATRPVINLANAFITVLAKLLPLPKGLAFYVVALIVGPLLGSFITEPAAMTVTALILKKAYYDRGISKNLMYATLGTLFVNVSIGGVLTNFAAPPVLMVAGKWGWGIGYMMTHFGWKAALAVSINTIAVAYLFRKELMAVTVEKNEANGSVPAWLTAVHLIFMGMVVLYAHHLVVFMGIFLFFLGTCAVTKEYQDELKLKEGLLVGFFLAGLVTLGAFQAWWLQPLIGALDELKLFLGATGLTAVTDNAALTYLGSLVDLTESSKYALVAGAVTGGGLTVIANAPNPAGFGILKESFGDEGISPVGLLMAAAGPTLVAGICFWFL